MPVVQVTNVEVLDNPTMFRNPFQFQITFECAPPGLQEGTRRKNKNFQYLTQEQLSFPQYATL
jgi:hypothetical protein